MNRTEEEPKVSVVIPNKGRVLLLGQALNSLIAQSFQEWEAIVIDDGSDPEELEGIRSLVAGDGRLRLVIRRDPPRGGNHCRNIGWNAARAPLLIFLDSDDCLSPACLEGRVQVIAANPELDFAVFPHKHFIRDPGDRDDIWCVDSGEDPLDRFLRFDTAWQTAGPVWRRAAIECLGGWDERLPSSQDWDMHVRALACQLRYHIFEKPIFFHRMPVNRESVTTRARGPEFVRGREIAYFKAADLLSVRMLMNSYRRLLFARLGLVLSEQWAQLGCSEAATRVWRECLRREWITEKQHRQGVRLLRIWPSRWKRGVYRRYLRLSWPRELRHDLKSSSNGGRPSAGSQ